MMGGIWGPPGPREGQECRKGVLAWSRVSMAFGDLLPSLLSQRVLEGQRRHVGSLLGVRSPLRTVAPSHGSLGIA